MTIMGKNLHVEGHEKSTFNVSWVIVIVVDVIVSVAVTLVVPEDNRISSVSHIVHSRGDRHWHVFRGGTNEHFNICISVSTMRVLVHIA